MRRWSDDGAGGRTLGAPHNYDASGVEWYPARLRTFKTRQLIPSHIAEPPGPPRESFRPSLHVLGDVQMRRWSANDQVKTLGEPSNFNKPGVHWVASGRLRTFVAWESQAHHSLQMARPERFAQAFMYWETYRCDNG